MKLLKASSKAKYSFWIKSLAGENMENFLQNKALPSFRMRLREYVNDGERHCERFSVTQKSVHIWCLHKSWTVFSVVLNLFCSSCSAPAFYDVHTDKPWSETKLEDPRWGCGKQVHGMWYFSFSAMTLLVGWQEEHPACKKTGCWFVGGDNLRGALHQ